VGLRSQTPSSVARRRNNLVSEVARCVQTRYKLAYKRPPINNPIYKDAVEMEEHY
jgi:hypothetical protein